MACMINWTRFCKSVRIETLEYFTLPIMVQFKFESGIEIVYNVLKNGMMLMQIWNVLSV